MIPIWIYLILAAAVGGYALGVSDRRLLRLGRSGDSLERDNRAVGCSGTPGRPGRGRHLRIVA